MPEVIAIFLLGLAIVLRRFMQLFKQENLKIYLKIFIDFWLLLKKKLINNFSSKKKTKKQKK